MKFITLILISFLYLNNIESQYYLLPQVKNGLNPSNLNNDYENQQGAGLTTGWQTILQGFQPAGNWSSTFSIPFKFYFNGALVTKYKASTSGIVTFNTKTSIRTDSNNIALPTSRVPDSSICIWGVRAAMGDFIVIKTFGTAPHRQLWISYNSFSELNLKSGHIFASVVLEESTNKIFIVDQRSQCISNNQPCTEKTSLTLGIQIDSTYAIMVPGSPDYQSDNFNDNTAADNTYFEFIPGIQPSLDMEAEKQLINKYYLFNNFPIAVEGIYKNIGIDNITSITYNYSRDNGIIISDEITGINLIPGAEYKLIHKVPLNISGNTYSSYNVRSWISKINNQDIIRPEDDTLSTNFIVNDTFYEKKVIHEIFTSSTSQPSKTGNDTIHRILNNSNGQYTELNYHMGNPQGGDPYFTMEAAARSRYYGNTTALPVLIVDGLNTISPVTYNNSLFNSLQEVPSLISLNSSGTIKDHQLDFKIIVHNEAPIVTNTRLFVALSEKLTKLNVKTNGETEFPHVMKKLLPDSLGFLLQTVPANSDQTYEFSWLIPSSYRLPADGRINNIINPDIEHSIENFANLELISWIQENNKNIMQSNSVDLTYTVATTDIKHKTSIDVFPNPSKDYFYVDLSEITINSKIEFVIISPQGKEVLRKQTLEKSLMIETSDWITGIYNLIAYVGNKVIHQRILIIE